ncbi:MAG: CPBP family intramembrane metalloprotease [Chloroflexi bacterium AL-W]|nr:CPBP family intramembrane metalloprotease [Chloroflexi bacterium AL-N1]NOK71151.1 CPBP family intramembrane metalloprotease [Chloroflexi bacterium AL-N10]NOK78617.1 CPBP family intramembrane metalloprotease [Chloroflexi bacterium AL-N5]NOK85913.1 CPBP family intramembrane metalloprotease [Chloroflexi bacterium AL-W]NOK92888.1 CPBP family intramembrane metalloprotease [Chloroflexi bacterium AL-N15]
MNSSITSEISTDNSVGLISGTGRMMVVFYTFLIAMAELVAAFVNVIAGVTIHAVLIPLLLSQYVLMPQASYRRILPVLTLLPLVRVLSISMIIRADAMPPLYWYVLVGIPMFVAVVFTMRLLSISWVRVGMPFTAPGFQMLIGLTGIPLGIVAYFITQPQALVGELNALHVVGGLISLIVFSAFLEELIYRGVLQQVATELFGGAGFVVSSILYTAIALSTLSPTNPNGLMQIGFIGLVGLYFAWCAKRTGSIWGVVIAHGVLNVIALLGGPFWWGG